MPDPIDLAPHPVELQNVLTVEGTDVHRFVWCPSYDACLNVACRRAWLSFSCATCPVWADARARGIDGPPKDDRTNGDMLRELMGLFGPEQGAA